MQIFRVTSLILLLGGLALAAQQQPPTSPQTKATHKRRSVKAVTKPKPVAPQPVAPPPAPPTPEQMPAQAPQVSYRDGLLSINAQNSTLGDVLRAVQQTTGASVDMPAAISERVAVRLGPAPPRKVLADLLLGSHYDYVILGAANDPNAVRSIILTPNASGPALAGNTPGAMPASAAATPPRQVRSEEADDDTMPPDAEAEDTGEVPYRRHPMAPPSVPPGQPGAITGPGLPAQPNQPPGGTGQPRVKSPEELLQELQRMQQQQQQQQQQQPSPQPQQNPSPPPQ